MGNIYILDLILQLNIPSLNLHRPSLGAINELLEMMEADWIYHMMLGKEFRYLLRNNEKRKTQIFFRLLNFAFMALGLIFVYL